MTSTPAIAGPGIIERLARARGDLRMGVPVMLTEGEAAAVAVPVETLGSARLEELRRLGQPELALTVRRAETLKIRVYDGDLARLALPADAGLDWLSAMADPADDLRLPMKGPFHEIRGGRPGLHRAAIALAKSARLLPAVVVVPVVQGAALARAADLTVIDIAEAAVELDRASPLSFRPACRWSQVRRGGCISFVPRTAARNIMPSRSGSRTARRRFWPACIRPVSPATYSAA
jgi:GTP cyclohydrolase II